ncbi:MAG: class I SAM-dependent methyltransferase [Planctomycetota bacterium]
MTTPQHPTLDRHRHSLQCSFTEWLREQRPGDVLDLGAGDGQLLEHLSLDGLRARGVESSDEAVERARTLGRDVVQGSIDGAEFVMPSAEWITIRHVLHHLAHPQRVMMRAAAAASRGLLVAEPFCATGLAQHAFTMRLESLCRSLDRRGGMIHARDLTAAELCDLIPMSWSIELRYHAPLTRLPAEDVTAMLKKSAARAGLDLAELDFADAREAAVIQEAARAGLVAAAGSLVIMACRPIGSLS